MFPKQSANVTERSDKNKTGQTSQPRTNTGTATQNPVQADPEEVDSDKRSFAIERSRQITKTGPKTKGGKNELGKEPSWIDLGRSSGTLKAGDQSNSVSFVNVPGPSIDSSIGGRANMTTTHFQQMTSNTSGTSLSTNMVLGHNVQTNFTPNDTSIPGPGPASKANMTFTGKEADTSQSFSGLGGSGVRQERSGVPPADPKTSYAYLPPGFQAPQGFQFGAQQAGFGVPQTGFGVQLGAQSMGIGTQQAGFGIGPGIQATGFGGSMAGFRAPPAGLGVNLAGPAGQTAALGPSVQSQHIDVLKNQPDRSIDQSMRDPSFLGDQSAQPNLTMNLSQSKIAPADQSRWIGGKVLDMIKGSLFNPAYWRRNPNVAEERQNDQNRQELRQERHQEPVPPAENNPLPAEIDNQAGNQASQDTSNQSDSIEFNSAEQAVEDSDMTESDDEGDELAGKASDKMTCGKTPLQKTYNDLLSSGYLLPNFKSGAITTEALDTVQNSRFIWLMESDVAGFDCSSIVLSYPNENTWSALQQLAANLRKKIFPFERPPDREFLKKVCVFLDPKNRYKNFRPATERPSPSECLVTLVNDASLTMGNNSAKTAILDQKKKYLSDSRNLLKELPPEKQIPVYQSEFYRLTKMIEEDRIPQDMSVFMAKQYGTDPVDLQNFKSQRAFLQKKMEFQINDEKYTRPEGTPHESNLMSVYQTIGPDNFIDYLNSIVSKPTTEQQKQQLQDVLNDMRTKLEVGRQNLRADINRSGLVGAERQRISERIDAIKTFPDLRKIEGEVSVLLQDTKKRVVNKNTIQALEVLRQLNRPTLQDAQAEVEHSLASHRTTETSKHKAKEILKKFKR